MAADGALLRPLQPSFPLSLLLLLLLFFFCSLSLANFPYATYGKCSRNATSTTFSRNLDTALSNLSALASVGTNYSTTTVGRSGQDMVYAVFQCRGDLSAESCSVCMQNATATARLLQHDCPHAVVASIQLDGCLLRYGSQSFFVLDTSVLLILCNTEGTIGETASPFAGLMNTVIKRAPAQGGFFAYATTSAAWAMAQCLGYLNKSECSQCLSSFSSRDLCDDVYLGSCFYRYGVHGISDTPSFVPIASGPAPSLALPPLPHSQSPGTSGPAPSLAFPPPPQSQSPGWKTPVIVVGVIGAITSAIAILMLCYKASNVKALALSRQPVDEADLVPTNAKVFSLKELQRATGNFDPTNKIGQGGFGIVYKGTLSDGQEVAIKKLIIGSQEGNQGFLNEVQLITSVRHKNLIRLLGCCVEDSQRILVYEYIPNKSLDFFLFGEAGESTALNWSTRYGIIVGMAKGLAYLHEESLIRIIHRDIKPSNILLDDGLNPVIADFGIARLVEASATHFKTGVAGTIGYLAPEYAIHGDLSERVDVFSFGLVCLEIIAGKRNTNSRLLTRAWEKYQIGRLVDLVDEKLGDAFSTEQAILVVHVALLCTQENPKQRPAMSMVTSWLLGMADILEMPTMPTFLICNESRSPFISPQSYSEKDSLKSGGVLSLIDVTEPR